MPRKSNELDKKLLLIGQIMIEEKGVLNFSFRELAKEANVNLGMLNYYFDSKDDFIKQVLLEIYGPFLLRLQLLSSSDDMKLEEFLFNLAKFSRDNRRMIFIIIRDCINNNSNIKNFISENLTSHLKLLKQIINKKFPLSNNNDIIFRMIISSIGMPNILLAFQEDFFSCKMKEETDHELLNRVNATIVAINSL